MLANIQAFHGDVHIATRYGDLDVVIKADVIVQYQSAATARGNEVSVLMGLPGIER